MKQGTAKTSIGRSGWLGAANNRNDPHAAAVSSGVRGISEEGELKHPGTSDSAQMAVKVHSGALGVPTALWQEVQLPWS